MPAADDTKDGPYGTAVPRAAGQPILAVVPEERGVDRVRAFARRWRALRYHHMEQHRPWLAMHDLCTSSCTGLTSRCIRAMEREGFLSATGPPAAQAAPAPPERGPAAAVAPKSAAA